VQERFVDESQSQLLAVPEEVKKTSEITRPASLLNLANEANSVPTPRIIPSIAELAIRGGTVLSAVVVVRLTFYPCGVVHGNRRVAGRLAQLHFPSKTSLSASNPMSSDPKGRPVSRVCFAATFNCTQYHNNARTLLVYFI